MFSILRLFIAGIVGASALHVRDERRVLLLGCSLDRNALLDFCWTQGENTNQTTEPMQTAWCFHHKLNVKLGYIWHPGVGLNGDLHSPFALARSKSTSAILSKYANETSLDMLGASPHLVVVDSSLWDLLAWRFGDSGLKTIDGKPSWGEPKEVTEVRVGQWCFHDLPNLLERVSEVFPTSRIAFRTAPTIEHTPGYEKFEKRDIELLYRCITTFTTGGKLLGKYDVIDYHAIMDKLIDRKLPDLFNKDGYHPGAYPSLLYINEVLRHVGLSPPEPQLEERLKADPRAR